MKRWTIPILMLAALLTGGSEVAEQEVKYHQKQVFAMNTVIDFIAYGGESKAALEQGEQEIRRLEGLFSVTDENSEIYRLSHGDGKSEKVSEETASLIDFGLKIGEETEGALDITMYQVLTAWGFTTGKYRIPEITKLATLLDRTGYEKVEVSQNRIQMPKEMELGAVSKGYIS